MEDYKREFIGFLIETGALKVDGDFTLKSGRQSPWFVNIGDFNDGVNTARLGAAYAKTITQHAGGGFDLVYGIPEKGVGLAIATSVELSRLGVNVPWFFTRKIAKDHGESSNLLPEEKIKARVVGRAPKSKQRIVQLDDVFTAGDAKYQARRELQEMGDFELPLLVIAVDRQEVGVDGTRAIERYERDTGTRVLAILSAADVFAYLQSNPTANKRAMERMTTYLRVYGTEVARAAVGNGLEQRIIAADRSIVPACDVSSIEQFEAIVKDTTDIDGVGGYKIGFELGLTFGLPRVVDVARRHTKKPIIYDHQKAGTDIPDTGRNFAQLCKNAGLDGVIFFPQAGPETERAWIYHALDKELRVIVGGRMTHPGYSVSEGGFITDEGALDMYRIAARAGVHDFVVPGNKPAVIAVIKKAIEAEGIRPVFYAPGFVAQGGKIADATTVAGDRWHAIVGRGIYQAKNYRTAALEHTSQIAPGS